MNIEIKSGCLVVVEGIDGTGKSTLATNIFNILTKMGYPVLLTAEPTDSTWGKKLRESFTSKRRLSPVQELELFLKDRREHVQKILLPALSQGKIIVCDRYYISTMAYQGARGLDVDDIRRKNEAFAPIPDLVLLLTLDPETAIKRIKHVRGDLPNNFEQLDYLKRVDQIFQTFSMPFVTRLNGTLSQEELAQESVKHILERCIRS